LPAELGEPPGYFLGKRERFCKAAFQIRLRYLAAKRIVQRKRKNRKAKFPHDALKKIRLTFDATVYIVRNMSNIKTDDLNRFANIFKALSNPHRLRIFMKLATCCAPGTICQVEPGSSAYVGELAENLDIVPSTVSHHIKELRQSGLIRMRRQGQKIECWVDPEVYNDLVKFFQGS
jgi:ArsR family transcriptional regulator, arsenate/arsenite/antimonite-responsive transcriptional repressor